MIEDFDTRWYDDLFTSGWYEKNEHLFKLDWDKGNFIHRVLKEYRDHLPDGLLHVIGRMVLEHPDSLAIVDVYGKSPLLHAANYGLGILFFVIDMLIPETIISEIEFPCTNDQESCPLEHISDGRRRQCLVIENTKQDATTPQFCHHRKIDTHKLVEENKKLRKAIENALGSDEEQAYHCLKSILRPTNFDEANFEKSEVDTKADDTEAGDTLWIRPFKTFLQLCPDSAFRHVPMDELTPLQMAVQLYGAEDLDYDLLFEVVQALIDRAPWSIFTTCIKDGDATTAYKILRDMRNLDNSPRKAPIIQAKELIKKTCIGYQDQIWDSQTNTSPSQINSEAKMNYLYSKVEHEKQLCFNLEGESEIIDQSYIKTIKNYSRLKLETALEFVRLPYWKPHQPDKTEESHKEDADEENADPYVNLFRYIWDQGTTKIFLLEVDDDGPEPHSNASIREALQGEESKSSSQGGDSHPSSLHDGGSKSSSPEGEKSEISATHDGESKSFPEEEGSKSLSPEREGLKLPSQPKFEIETWKWKKFDICTETVATAAPTARHVWLWSSGNTAVLRGWACGSGLERMKELESLTIVINPKVGKIGTPGVMLKIVTDKLQNTRDTDDCNKYLKTFKLDISKKCHRLSMDSIKIQVNPPYQTTQKRSDEGATELGNHNALHNMYKKAERSSDWIQELSCFKQFIGNLVRKSNLEVKVAVIDDGCRLTGVKGTKPIGRSFCADDREYFAGRCEHGTSMARCIREVCPTSNLYIARLDVSRKAENQAFTLESCCKALKWAIAVGVDVICMSWTFPIKELDEGSYEAEFSRLVEEAARKNIILFGSLPDKGPTIQMSDLAPIGLKKVIRIGSATVHGEGMPENLFAEADFLLPGEESTVRGGVIKGSSYATAYASGLAAAVLLTIKLLKKYSGDETHDEIDRAYNIACTKEGMKGIFKRLSADDSTNQTMNAYVRPYLVLGQKASDFNDSDTGKQQTLKKITQKFLLRDIPGFHG
ncbi:hypothetical protein TrVFT333_010337 [Trichoderma virens FT-333]|nr:hypothetical protein TrVFT333_010337 [Trichoderma virens FT-333]